MMEIILVVILFKKLKAISDKKNQSKWFPWLLPLLWFTGEFITPFIVAFIYVILGKSMENNLLLYGYALIGAALGTVIAFRIVHSLPTKSLTCPECGWEFTKTSPLGAECKECNSKLKVVAGKVSRLQNAQLSLSSSE